MRTKGALISAGLLLFLLVGCRKPSHGIDYTGIQCQAWLVFDSVAARTDTPAAVSATVEFLENSDGVAWAIYNGCGGISLTYDDSTPSIMLYRLPGDDTGGFSVLTPPSQAAREMPMRFAGSIPTKTGAAFLSPYYWQFSGGPPYFDDSYIVILSAMESWLPKVGFPSPTVVLNKHVTPEVFADLCGYGMIDIESHGAVPFPTQQNPTWVALVLYADTSAATRQRFRRDMEEPPITLWKVSIDKPPTGSSEYPYWTYAVLPGFMADHNRSRWQVDHPLILSNICYGFLGGWPEAMVAAGASAYLSWDWESLVAKNRDYACSLYTHMCQTPVSDPFAATVAAFFADVKPEYYFEKEKRTVHLRYAGDPLTTFQDPVPEGWRVGPYNPVFDFIAGAWGPNTLDLSFRVWGQEFPLAGLEVRNPDQLRVGVPVTPDVVSVILPTGEAYTSLLYQDKCKIVFTKIEKPESPGTGSVSGVLAGYVYDMNAQGEPVFVPVSCQFENISVYSSKVDAGLSRLPGSRKEHR